MLRIKSINNAKFHHHKKIVRLRETRKQSCSLEQFILKNNV